MKISTAARNAACNAIAALVDGGPLAGILQIRTGPPPSSTADPDSGTLLATLTFSDPAFAAAIGGAASANAIAPDVSVDATGTAGHFRIKDSLGTVVMQGTVGTGGADLNFNTTAFVAGGTAAITSLQLVVPEGV